MATDLIEAPDPATLGPCMAALSEQRRRFVIAYAACANGAQAAREAGYSDAGEACKVRASVMLREPKVLAAIREVSLETMRGQGVMASTNALLRIIDDPEASHGDRIKAADSVLDRCGLSRQTQHQVTVEHTDNRSTADMARILAEYVDRKRLQSQEVIDVTPED